MKFALLFRRFAFAFSLGVSFLLTSALAGIVERAPAAQRLNTSAIIETTHNGASLKAYGDRDVTTHRSYRDHRDWDAAVVTQ